MGQSPWDFDVLAQPPPRLKALWDKQEQVHIVLAIPGRLGNTRADAPVPQLPSP